MCPTLSTSPLDGPTFRAIPFMKSPKPWRTSSWLALQGKCSTIEGTSGKSFRQCSQVSRRSSRRFLRFFRRCSFLWSRMGTHTDSFNLCLSGFARRSIDPRLCSLLICSTLSRTGLSSIGRSYPTRRCITRSCLGELQSRPKHVPQGKIREAVGHRAAPGSAELLKRTCASASLPQRRTANWGYSRKGSHVRRMCGILRRTCVS
jgi:hypothetical protein